MDGKVEREVADIAALQGGDIGAPVSVALPGVGGDDGLGDRAGDGAGSEDGARVLAASELAALPARDGAKVVDRSARGLACRARATG